MWWFKRKKKQPSILNPTKEEVEFQKNLEILKKEYGQDLGGLTHSQATGKMIVNLLERIKALENANRK